MSIYSDKQQSRVAVNPKTGESKVFKSTGVDAKGITRALINNIENIM